MNDDATGARSGLAGDTASATRRVLGKRYEMIAPIASGGFGTVYKGRDVLLDRTIAIKVLHPSRAISAEARERFLREARATARLQHENVVAVFDAGEAEEQLFLVLEYVEGQPLGALIREGPPDVETATRIIIEIARALEAAHRMGIVHRDIKPPNVLIRDDGHVKVTDFGVARLADDVDLTRDGAIVGTPKYMSPEQLDGEKVGAASDLFSLGCVAYELLTGAVPFEGDTLSEVLGNIRRGNVRPIPLALRAKAPILCDVIDRLLQLDPEARQPNAAAVVEQLSRGTRRVRNLRRIGWIAATVVTVLLIAASAWIMKQRGGTAQRTIAVKDPASLVALIAARTGAVQPSGSPVASSGNVFFYRGRGRRPTIISKTQTQARKGTVVLSIAGLSFDLRRGTAKNIEVRAPANEIDAAVQAVKLYDALSDYRFGQEPNLLTGDGASKRQIAMVSHGLEPQRLIELIASAAGWPVVIDPSAGEAVGKKLGSAPMPEYDLNAPWDEIVDTLMRRYDLAAYRLQKGWIIASVDRWRQLDQRRPLDSVFVPIAKGSLEDAARAASAASSPRGLVLINRRLEGLVLHDYPNVTTRQGDVLAALEAVPRQFGQHGNVATRTYDGAPFDVHLHSADLRDFISVISRATGLPVVIDPRAHGLVNANLDDIAWDEAMELVLSITRNSFMIKTMILEVTPEKEMSPEEVVVETVKLRHDDPAFWAPFQKGFQDRGGSLIVDRQARALIIRDKKSQVASLRSIATNLDGIPSRGTMKRVTDEIAVHGLKAAVSMQERLRATDPDFDFAEAEWNQIGYLLLGRKKGALALDVFKKNIADHPDSWNAYDSLAEAYMNGGERKLAITNYQKSLSLNPDNGNARRMLWKLQR